VKNVKQTAMIILVAAIVISLISSFYILEEGQQAVIVQFGRPVGETVTKAGLHIKIPFIQEVRRFEKRLLIWDGDPNQIPTKGREFIWVDTTARWRIADARKFLENVATEAGAQSRLNDIIDSVVRDQVSSSELVELVRSSSWKVPGEEVLQAIAAARATGAEIYLADREIRITLSYGIELVDVRIKRLDYVESVREKGYVRMISERKRIAAQFRSEGEGQSAEILGTMEKELRRIRSTAYRRVQEIRGKADAEATRIYAKSYSRNPEFYSFLRTLEVYGEGSNKNSVAILTTDSDFYRYLKSAYPKGASSGRGAAAK